MIFPFDAAALFLKWTKLRDLPRNDFEKQAILVKLIQHYEDKRVYSETEVNEHLKVIFDDHVLVRRELVNFGYLDRDPLAGTYWVKKRELTLEDIKKNTILKRHAKSYGIE